MNYRDKVINYFQFTSSMSVSIGSKIKKTINISNKPTKRTIIFFLVFISIFYIISIIENITFGSAIEQKFISLTSLLITIFLPIIATLLVFIKSKRIFSQKEPLPTNINIYQRELPSKLKPAHVRMLLNDGLVDETTIASTLLDLIDNGYLEMSKSTSKLDIFKNDIILTKTNKDQNNLLQYEKFLIKWFIDDCGNRTNVTSNEIKKYLLTTKNATYPPHYLFEYFQALVIISFPFHKYYLNRNISKSIILHTILIFIGFMSITTLIGVSLFIYGLGSLLFCNPRYTLNNNGVEEEDKWLDLKRFLKDFSDIKNKNSEMIILWEHYMTYSVALGIDSIASKEIEDFFGKEIYNGPVQTDTDTPNTNDEMTNQVIAKDIELEKIKYEQIIGLK